MLFDPTDDSAIEFEFAAAAADSMIRASIGLERFLRASFGAANVRIYI